MKKFILLTLTIPYLLMLIPYPASPSESVHSMTGSPPISPLPGDLLYNRAMNNAYFSHPPNSGTYYVSNQGDDSNPGTLKMPWQTIQKALDFVSPGNSIQVRGGIYPEQVRVTHSGDEEEGYITLQNYPGEVPVIDGSSLTLSGVTPCALLVEDRNDIIIQGFEIRNFRTSKQDVTPAGIYLLGSSHHIILSDNHIHQIETTAPVGSDKNRANAHGIAVYGTKASSSIHDIIIRGNELDHLALGSSEALVLNGNVENFLIEGNRIHDVNNIAIDCIGFEQTAPDPLYDQARDGRIFNNTIYNITSFGNPAYGTEYSSAGIYIDGGSDILVECNTVYSSDIGIELASEHAGRATRTIIVRNNILFNNAMCGIAMGGYDKYRGRTEDCVIVNNTLYHNDVVKDGNGELLIQFDTRRNVIKNNILFASSQNLLIANPYSANTDNVLDYNLYFAPGGSAESEWQWKNKNHQGFTSYQTSTGNDPHSLFGNPVFIDAVSGDFHLNSSSPAIDKGENISAAGETDCDGQPRIQNTRVDIGAYEVTEVVPVTLVSFTAKTKRNKVELRWTTASEVNNSGFEIQRATATASECCCHHDEFHTIKVIYGYGTITSRRDYSHTDNQVDPGRYCYRLKITANDGTFETSPVVQVVMEAPYHFFMSQNYPNPFNSNTRIHYNLPIAARVTAELFNISGERIAQFFDGDKSPGFHILEINADAINGGLASGLYFLKMNAANRTTGRSLNGMTRLVFVK